LRYEENNAYTDKAAFIGDMSLIDSIMKIKNEKEIRAVVHVLHAIKSQGNRKELASYTHEMIQKNLSHNLS
jgi:1-acyl-sn-glycerol-3-phosphate acyltransferase